MPLFTASATDVASPSIGSRVLAAGGALVGFVQRAYAERAAISALEAMDDRMLADLGITRGDIPFAVRNRRFVR